METILFFALDIILSFIAYILYTAVLIPYAEKEKAFKKLKAKEREELDRRMQVERFFGAKVVENK